MQITKVMVGVNRKLNMGNYETKDYSITAEAVLEEGESLFEVSNRVKQALEHQVEGWEMETKGITPKIETANELVKPVVLEKPLKDTTEFVCPECKEKMQKKEGKDYYLCSKHWGYPAMINKGEVRERNYSAKQTAN